MIIDLKELEKSLKKYKKYNYVNTEMEKTVLTLAKEVNKAISSKNLTMEKIRKKVDDIGERILPFYDLDKGIARGYQVLLCTNLANCNEKLFDNWINDYEFLINFNFISGMDNEEREIYLAVKKKLEEYAIKNKFSQRFKNILDFPNDYRNLGKILDNELLKRTKNIPSFFAIHYCLMDELDMILTR